MLPLPLNPWEVGLTLILGIILSKTSVEGIKHYGVKIGDLSTLLHGLSGEVYAADERHIFLKTLSYDGTGPDAFFWVGKTDEPDKNGVIVPFPRKEGTPVKLNKFDKEMFVMMELPKNYYITDNIKYFCVWCRKFQANFGMVKILSSFKLPKQRENIGRLKTLNRTEVSGDVTILDSKIIRIPEFIFDWKSDKKTYFMIAKKKNNQSTHAGAFIAHVKKDGIYTPAPLDEYTGKDTVYVKLPGDLEIQEFDVLIVNCPECLKNKQIYGFLKIPTNLLDGIPIPAHVDEKQLEIELGIPTSTSQNNILKNPFIIIIANIFLQLQFYI